MENICQCPKCKTILKFDNSIDRNVKCPKCAYQGRTTDFKEVPTQVVCCPACNANLTIRIQEGKYEIQCPVCKHILKKSKEQVQADTTTTGGWEDKKQLLKPCTLILVNGSGVAPETIELKRGVNTIGRKSSSSQSSIQIQGDEYISRNHATIEVVMKKDGNFEHRLSDNNSKNRTYHNDTPLEAGDINVLMPGDTVGFGLRTVFKMCYGINDL